MHLIIISVLIVLLLIAVWQDIRTYKIKNKLVVSGIFCAISLNLLLPETISLYESFAGLFMGSLLLLPLYLLRVMGAGDIKLMAMIGAFVGSNDIFIVFLYVVIAGGLQGLLILLKRSKLQKQLSTTLRLLPVKSGQLVDGQVIHKQGHEFSGKMPYAVAIATGTLVFIAVPYI